MALAASLLPGFQYEITGGPLEGEVVTIVDNTRSPMATPRVVSARSPASTTMGGEFYILPRLLGNSPVGMDDAVSRSGWSRFLGTGALQS